MVSVEQILSKFIYKNDDLYHRESTSRGIKAGDLAGWSDPLGYRIVLIDGKRYFVHRLIYQINTGECPDTVDHRNNIPSDNRMCNLRACTQTENMWNTRMKRNNTSGVKGVSWHKQRQKWTVRISVNGTYRSFGLHDDLEFAELVADEVRHKYHGEYANNG